MYGPRGRITSFFRAVKRFSRTPVGLYGAARAGSALGTAARSAYGARRRITPLPRIPKVFPKRFVGFPVSGPVVTGAGGVSSHVFSVSGAPTKQVSAMERVGAPNIYTKQANLELIATAGNQNAGYVSYAPPLDLSTIGGLNSNTATGPNRFVLEDIQAETVMTNQSTAPMDIEIWDLVLKRDMPSYSNTQWKVGGFATPTNIIGDPVSYWEAGLRAGLGAVNVIGTPNYVETIGSSPYDSQFFKDMFLCVKKTNVVLNQGASHRIASLQKVHKLVDQAKWATATVTGTSNWTLSGLGGYTTYSMIRIKGLPCTIDPDVGTGVTTSAARLAVVQYTRYKYTWVQDSTNTLLYGETLQSPASGAGIINIGSGLPEDQQFAPGA